MIGMILAGGRGKRMDMLCHLRPKPALPFAGRFHVIDFSLSNCVHSQVTSLAALTDYQGPQMAEYLQQWETENRLPGKISILPPETGSYKGTADAVYRNLGYLNRALEDRVLVLAGDHIYKMDYRKMLAFHEDSQADVTVGVVQAPLETAHRFGTVTIDAQSRIQKFVEKSSNPISTMVSMGIYIFNKDLLAQRLAEDSGKPDSPHDFGYAILPEMVKRDRVYAYQFDGYWEDIGTIEAYYEANMDLLSGEPRLSLNGHWPVFTRYNSWPQPAELAAGNIVNSLIGPGCVIKGKVENSILSPGVFVAKEAVVRNSIIMANTVIGYHSVIDRCILDEAVEVGKFCYVGFGGGGQSGIQDITVLGREARVPPYTGIGRKCKVLPRARASNFASGLIHSGSVVSPGVSVA